MSNTQPSNRTDAVQSPGTTLALILVWALTLLVTQAAIWSTARILDHSNAVENDISWGQAGLLSFIWVFVRTWHRALVGPVKPQ